ncbi:PucR family transcriptional regulator ligand-binding domain-containing protein [Paenibacillus sp. TRM 82003]|nr:PucR family transcriptional regulator ligand-binding domain-containing protein [Paenibacillus sp. TRM 82003]
MHLTVEQALAIYPLSEGKLVAGTSGRHRVVRSINVMDAPDISDWIKEGEMLFTTAYLIKDRPDEASRLLNKLNVRGSSGLGIKLGRFWDRVPSALIEEADALGFPLIELPYQFTFSDQMNALFRAEIERSTNALHSVLEKQKRLMRFALQSDPMSHLFDAVADIVEYPIAVVNARGQIVFNNATFCPDREVMKASGRDEDGGFVRGPGWQAFRVPLARREERTGFAYFFASDPLHIAVEESLFLQAAELISFHMNFNVQDYFERSLQRDFGALVKRCLLGGLPTEELAEYADKLDISVFQGSYYCVLTDVSSSAGDDDRLGKLQRLKEEYVAHPPLHELQGIHAVMEEGLLSLFPAETDGGGRLSERLAACLKSIEATFDTAPRAAISGRKGTPKSLCDAYDEAKQTLRLARQWNVREQVVHYRSLELSHIFEDVSRERMAKYADNILGPLLCKEPDYVQEMLKTLEAYLESDGHMNETSKKLFIHRNTATYRIEKLSELLEVDLKSINDLLRLKLVFLFRRAMGSNG